MGSSAMAEALSSFGSLSGPEVELAMNLVQQQQPAMQQTTSYAGSSLRRVQLGGSMGERYFAQNGNEVCKHFLRNRCTYGDACRFSHDPADIASAGFNPLELTPLRKTPRLVVTGMPAAWGVADLASFFTAYGQVVECDVQGGLGYVRFARHPETERVIHTLHLSPPVEGCRLACSVEASAPPDPIPFRPPPTKRPYEQLQPQSQPQPHPQPHPQPPPQQPPDDLVSALLGMSQSSQDALRDQLLALVSGQQQQQLPPQQKRRRTPAGYILLKAPSHEALSVSVEEEAWEVSDTAAQKINTLVEDDTQVTAIFSVRGMDGYAGYGRVTGAARAGRVPVVWQAVGATSFSELPHIPSEDFQDGNVLSASDGAEVCERIAAAAKRLAAPKQQQQQQQQQEQQQQEPEATPAPASSSSDLSDGIDITSIGYEDYVKLMQQRQQKETEKDKKGGEEAPKEGGSTDAAAS